jgi:hypothetical protein
MHVISKIIINDIKTVSMIICHLTMLYRLSCLHWTNSLKWLWTVSKKTLQYLLTYGALSPSWEAANCAATQELPSILRNPKVHYLVHMSPPLVPNLSQIDRVHTIPSCLSKIYFNIVHPPTSWSS